MVRRIKTILDRPAMWIVEKFNSVFQRKANVNRNDSTDGQLATINEQQQPYQHIQVKRFIL